VSTKPRSIKKMIVLIRAASIPMNMVTREARRPSFESFAMRMKRTNVRKVRPQAMCGETYY